MGALSGRELTPYFIYFIAVHGCRRCCGRCRLPRGRSSGHCSSHPCHKVSQPNHQLPQLSIRVASTHAMPCCPSWSVASDLSLLCGTPPSRHDYHCVHHHHHYHLPVHHESELYPAQSSPRFFRLPSRDFSCVCLPTDLTDWLADLYGLWHLWNSYLVISDTTIFDLHGMTIVNGLTEAAVRWFLLPFSSRHDSCTIRFIPSSEAHET